MSKMSILPKGIIVAVLIALVLASFPTAGVLAGSTRGDLEDKWEQLVTNFNRQSLTHNGAHRWVDRWLKMEKSASASEKDEVRRHLSVCNSALMSAQVIVSNHAGFDAKGKVIDKALAVKTVKDLAYYLRQHASSVKKIVEHM
jgi:hypothetical protein